ncbi:MAG TPA: amidohydrolase family protein [Pyrinomonadaceae bacterium]|nr:amidohydrolase family protein [Pyrinomonadaceae bacterium]
MLRKLLKVILILVVVPSPVFAQHGADPQLVAEINKIKAIDNHAHPLRYVAEGDKPDDEYDALPLEGIDPFPLPLRLSTENLEFIGAWKHFYSYDHNDMLQAHTDELLAIKKKVLQQQGQNFPNWVLDQLNIETMFANRVAMGRGLTPPSFRWVSFVDALLFPLNNEIAKRSNRDYAGFYPGEEKLLKRYLADLGLKRLPATLNEYLTKVVTATLERQKAQGVIALKYEAAYLRLLDFEKPDRRVAFATYARFSRKGVPPAKDYKALQDFLFYHIAKEAGRLRLAIHIHVFEGAGSYYRPSGSNPLLLESIFNDSELRKTNFVLVHGGLPFTQQVRSMFGKPNVYADFSAQTLFLYPRALSEVLRTWLEAYPDRVLFGTDAFSFGPLIDWPEVAWLSNTTARQALALALTGMMNDGEISRERAVELARMVLRDNAIKLYKL